MRSRSLYLVLALFVCCFSGACRSTIGGGQAKAELTNKNLDEVNDDLDDLSAQVEQSSATPEQKKNMRSRIATIKPKVEAVKPAVVELGKQADTNQEIAVSNEAKAKAFNLIVMLVGLAVLGAVIYLIRMRKS